MAFKKMRRLTVCLLAAAMVLTASPVSPVRAADGAASYKDGTYEGAGTASDKEEENFEDYAVSVKVTVKNGVIAEVTPDVNAGLDGDNDSYIKYALEGRTRKKVFYPSVLEQVKGMRGLHAAYDEDENLYYAASDGEGNEVVIDAVSGATCTSNAILEAAVNALADAAEEESEAPTEAPTEEVTEAPTEEVTEAPTEEVTEAPTEEMTEATAEEPAGEPVAASAYVMMNIPFAEFYAAEVNNDVQVDVFTSATLNKTRTPRMAGATYHKQDGSEVNGVRYPVFVEDPAVLADCQQITDDSSYEVTVTNRGQTTTTVYEGQDALFGAPAYAYYVLGAEPAYYKNLSVNEDGSFAFSASTGEVTGKTVEAVLLTDSGYGDYQLNFESADALGLADADIHAVVVNTKEGAGYGMRPLENIWLKYELAWCTGFTESVHGCPVSSAHYEAMMGQTITDVKYFTSKGIVVYDIEDTYVPVKTGAAVTVSDALVSAGSASIEVTNLGEGFDPVYTVEGLEGVSVSDGTLTYDAEAAKIGNYTLTITDASGVYAPISTSFQLYTTDIPAVFNGKDALAAADGASEEDFAAYLAAVTSVIVNDTEYSARGRRAVVIIEEDGSINLEKTGLEVICGAQFTVKATGYADYSFSAGHAYVRETVKASVTADGYITYTCSVCGDVKETIIPGIASVVLAENKFVYDGQDHAVSLVVTDAEGNVIPEKYYVLKQTVSASAVGRYTVAVAFKGRYTGVVKKTFKISPADVAISSVKGTAGRFRLVFGQRSDDMDGIQVEYSTSPDFTDSVKVNTTLAAKNIYVEAGTYYVRIRTYKRIEGKPTLFSAWSAAQEVTVK